MTNYQCNIQSKLAYGSYTILSGEELHDFFIGVTYGDFATAPEPGNYSLCQEQYKGAVTTGQILDLQCDRGVKGRYVWIQVPGDKEILALCEVQVFEAGQLHAYY